MKLKEVFKTLDSEGNEVELAVRRPTPKNKQDAQAESNHTFYNLVNSPKKTILRSQLEIDLRERGLWGDKQQEQFEALTKSLADNELALQKGGISLGDAKERAIKMVKDRQDLNNLVAERRQLDSLTVEGICENIYFNYLVYSTLVYNSDGKPFYSSFEEYQEKSNEIAAVKAATTLMAMLHGVDADIKANLPEYQFLKKYKFVDEKYRLINKEGRLVSLDGKLVNSEGRYIDDSGNLIDSEGRPVDAEGNLVIEFSPFLDDSGNPVEADQS